MDTAIIIFLLLPNTPLFSAGPAKYRLNADAPMRGRQAVTRRSSWLMAFQSTPPHGGDRDAGPVGWYRSNFNPRPLAGATCPFLILSAIRSIFQSTPPYGGDPVTGNPGLLYAISIHAPIRGRQLPLQSCPLLLQFQSTPPYGGDRNERYSAPSCQISIHAPIRGRRECCGF